MSAQMFEVPLLGVGTVLRVERKGKRGQDSNDQGKQQGMITPHPPRPAPQSPTPRVSPLNNHGQEVLTQNSSNSRLTSLKYFHKISVVTFFHSSFDIFFRRRSLACTLRVILRPRCAMFCTHTCVRSY